MSRAVVSVPSDLDAESAWEQMRTANVHHLVVVDGERITGMITDRDLGGMRGDSVRSGKRVADLMAPSVLVITPEMSVASAANLMRCNTISCLPVVEGKTLVGIVTTSDILEMVGSHRR